MKKVYIRWIGAFAGRNYSLRESIKFELTRKDEAACEPVVCGKEHPSGVARDLQIGLLISKNNIFREFKADCWSFYGQDREKSLAAKKDQNPSRLYASSLKRVSSHAEAWARMPDAITGIVVYRSFYELPQDRKNVILKAARKNSLAIYTLTRKGELRKEEV
jgi:hypothetical protein